ncbi:hypothetical protein BSKO_14019 [Bryopsis sp. KO-2023]|nr:hypothetical protein BSKO_14019 [Bryopsis sp. KO-2023]
MDSSKAKGASYVEQAQKKLKSWSLFGSSSKNEDAAELLGKAANHFKLGKAWQEAGDTYTQMAEIHMKLGVKHEAANAYVEAAKALMKVPSDEGIKCLHTAVEIYTDMGRLNQAARYLKEIGEQVEKQDQYKEAVEFYGKAAELFSIENSSSEENKCLLKVAQYEAKLGHHKKAVEIYEGVARQAAEHQLLKYSAKGYLLNAGVCRLCYAEPDSMETAIERYKEIDITFPSSRECQLLENLSEAMVNGDVQKFTDDIAEYDSLSKLDEWKTSMLLEVKKRIQKRNDGEEGEDDDDDLV